MLHLRLRKTPYLGVHETGGTSIFHRHVWGVYVRRSQNGVKSTANVAHMRLCHSRMLFVRAKPRETQEMVFDAHDQTFASFKGASARGIYTI
jgi:hypothetical protein